MKKIIVAALFLGLSLTLFAADNGKVIMATTDDGRKVVLLPDGTWKWIDMGSTAPTPKGSKDEDWRKITGYLVDQGYTIKNNDGLSRTLTTDWQNKVLPSLNAKSMSGPGKVCNMGGCYQWMITLVLSENTPKLAFKYMLIPQSPGPHTYGPMEVTLEKGICNNPLAKDACSKLTENEKLLNEEINALLKPAPLPVQEKK